mmetsp:Transcript_30338/g.67276  ORF Transcript_30338/g.67276 Transcript_30338/m.67276 type:complete len:209 (+) Transcript_30338:371-997(+)
MRVFRLCGGGLRERCLERARGGLSADPTRATASADTSAEACSRLPALADLLCPCWCSSAGEERPNALSGSCDASMPVPTFLMRRTGSTPSLPLALPLPLSSTGSLPSLRRLGTDRPEGCSRSRVPPRPGAAPRRAVLAPRRSSLCCLSASCFSMSACWDTISMARCRSSLRIASSSRNILTLVGCCPDGSAPRVAPPWGGVPGRGCAP